VHVLQVPAKVATLGEAFRALGTFEWAEACVLAKVVPQITTLFEN
jgi:hypothetical protein